jgi:hypothetical protein
MNLLFQSNLETGYVYYHGYDREYYGEDGKRKLVEATAYFGGSTEKSQK